MTRRSNQKESPNLENIGRERRRIIVTLKVVAINLLTRRRINGWQIAICDLFLKQFDPKVKVLMKIAAHNLANILYIRGISQKFNDSYNYHNKFINCKAEFI